MKTISYTLLDEWNGIDEKYHETCKKIITYSFTHEFFKEAELKRTLLSGWFGQKHDVAKAVRSLVKANILSAIGGGTYTFHSKLEKDYLAANMDELG